MRQLKYLITGTGRCGTVYMARFLTSLGIHCGHESIFDWRGYRWAEMKLKGGEPLECSTASTMSLIDGKWVPELLWIDVSKIMAESSYMAVPFLGDPIIKDVPVIHVVRNPIRVINSFCNYIGYFQSGNGSNSYEQFIYRHLPELQKSMPPYDRAALFYILWNELIEGKSSFFHRIEDDTDLLLGFLNKNSGEYNNTRINSQAKSGKRFVWEDIQSIEIGQRLLRKCRQYNYSGRVMLT